MAGSDFNITAQIHLQAPNVKAFSRDLQNQLKDPKLSVNLQGGPQTVKGLNKVAKATKEIEKESKRAGKGADYMGRQLGSAFKQIVKYDIARRIFSLFADAIESGVRDAIAFERAMVKVAQVSGASAREMKNLEQSISRVAKQFGVSSQSLAKTTLILKQTGLSINDTRIAMEALAKTELAPTFENITDTAEMAIAAMRQFGIEASKLEGLLGRINVVAANFAVEASDIGVAIRRAGGAFKAAGGEVEELIALFTSVRATTRETAETIATGFRTIFTRLQRPTTIKFLRQFGIELTDLSGKFVGPYKAVERLHGALKNLDPKDLRFSMIVEQLGGFRQVSKVIPLIQQFGTAQAALNAQQAESGSLASDAAKAQQTLAVQLQKLTENVKELFREIVASDTFQMMAKGAIALANAIVKVGKALAPVIPLITAMMGMKMAGWAMGSMKMMGGRGLMSATGSMSGGGGLGGGGGYNRGGRVKRFSQGGWVPGSGNGDTVPAMLEPGEFVLRKSAAQAYGSRLNGVNKYVTGGRAKNVAAAQLKYNSTTDGDSLNVDFVPRKRWQNSSSRLLGYDAYEKGGAGAKTKGTLYERALGNHATQVMDKYIKGKTAKQIKKMFDEGDAFSGDKMKYGRLPFRAGNFGASLVKKGLAVKGGSATGGLSAKLEAWAMNEANGTPLPPGLGAYPKGPPAGMEYKKWVTTRKQAIMRRPNFQAAKGGEVPSLLTPGEFVVNKKSAQSFGYGRLSRMNKFAGGGAVRRYAGGTGGSDVLPMGMGGGMGGMMPMMMMQMSGMGDVMGKTTKAAGSAIQGLTNVASSATMAYAKFQFVTQSVGAFAGMLGLSSEKLDYFINRVGEVGGAMAAAFNILSSPAAQKGVSKAFDWAMLALMAFGGKLKGVTKLIPGGAKTAVAGVVAGGSRTAGIGAGAFAGAGMKNTMGAIYSKKYRQGLVGKTAGHGRMMGGHLADAKAYGKTSQWAKGAQQSFFKQQTGAISLQQKAANKVRDARSVRGGLHQQLNKVNSQLGLKNLPNAARTGLAADKQLLEKALLENTKAIKAGTQEAAEQGAKALAAGQRATGAGKLATHSGKAATTSLRAANASKAAAKASALLVRNGVKLAKALTGVGIGLIILEESVGYLGRAMEQKALEEIKAGKGDLSAEDEARLTKKAGTGGAIAGAATGAGIGASIGLLFGPYAVIAVPLLAAIGAAAGGLWGFFAAIEGAKEAIETAKFNKASREMTDAMKKFSEGTVSAGFAVRKIGAMRNQLDAMQEFGAGSTLGDVFGKEVEVRQHSATVLNKRAQDARSLDEFDNDYIIQKMQKKRSTTNEYNEPSTTMHRKWYDFMQGNVSAGISGAGAEDISDISDEQVAEARKIVEANVKARKAMDAFREAQEAANKMLRKVLGFVDAMSEATIGLKQFGARIENLAERGSGGIGKTADLFNKAGTSKKATEGVNLAIDKFSNIAGGDSLKPFAKKAKDAQFISTNIEDILRRSGMSAGLDTDNTREVIKEDLERTLKAEGHTLGPYMQKRIEKMIDGIDEADLTDLEGNAEDIAKQIKEDDSFMDVFKAASELLDEYNGQLESAYAAKLKLEQEYITRQQSLMQARFDSEEKFRQNLSASAFSGTSNADVQANFMGKQRMLVEGANGIGGMTADRQASLAAKGGVGSVDAVGQLFREIGAELAANQQELIDKGFDPNALGDANTKALADSQQELIKRNKELKNEYASTKKILENYANSQERLIALNRELERASQKRKTLKELAVQARYGTAEEKDQAARLINAITIGMTQGVDAVAPELQRQILPYMTSIGGAQGESMINQGINNAYGGGSGIAGITEVSAEERRLATEIKAIEDAGITAGEHLAEEVADKIKDMADAIQELNKKFIIDLRTLFLEQREKQAKSDLREADAKIAGIEKKQLALKKFGIEGATDAQGNVTYSDEDQMRLNAVGSIAGGASSITALEKQETAYAGKDLNKIVKNMGGLHKMIETMANPGQELTFDMFEVAMNAALSRSTAGILGEGAVEGAVGIGESMQSMKDLAEATGVTNYEMFNALNEGLTGENYDIETSTDSHIKALKGIVVKLAGNFSAAGGDATEIYAAANAAANADDAEAQDVIKAVVKIMAAEQEAAQTGLEDMKETLEDAGFGEAEIGDIIKDLKDMSQEERDAYVKEALQVKSIGNLDELADDLKHANDQRDEAKVELDKIKDASTKLTAEATNRGSIYTHDVHLEKILLNILSVLETGARSVELDATSKDLLGGGTGAHAVSAITKKMNAEEGTAAQLLAGSAGLSSKMADKSGAFMSKYGGQSLAELQGMATDGGLDKNFMTDLDASSLSDEAKQSIKDTIEGADGWMAGNSGVGSYNALDGGTTLSEAMGPDFMKEAVTQAVSELVTGSAAQSIATQMMAIVDTSALTDITDTFSKNIGEFSTAMGSPLNIEVGGSIDVNVNMSGAEFLKDAGGALQQMAGSATTKAINNFITTMNKSSNVKPRPDWADSGQSGPITGNQGGG